MLAQKKELLKRALLEARLNELEAIPSAEVLEQEHVFSLSFEKKMKVITHRKKISTIIKKAGKYVAGFAVICVLTGSAFVLIQNGGIFSDKLVSNDTAKEEFVEDVQDLFEGEAEVEDYFADEESLASATGNRPSVETAATGNSVYEIDTDVIPAIYEENGSTIIELDYTDSEVLSQGITDSYITYVSYAEVNDSDVTEDQDINDSASSLTTSALANIKLDEELYDIIEEGTLVKYVIDSEQVKEFSSLYIYLEAEADTVRLSFKVNEADGTLSLIE